MTYTYLETLAKYKVWEYRIGGWILGTMVVIFLLGWMYCTVVDYWYSRKRKKK